MLLAEALVALALLGMLMLGAFSLALSSVAAVGEAERMNRAREAAERILHELESIGFHDLPRFFGSRGDAFSARLSSAGKSAPEGWAAALAGLPEGRVEAVLQGLGVTGESVSFDDAQALRLRVRVSYREQGRTRRVALAAVRF